MAKRHQEILYEELEKAHNVLSSFKLKSLNSEVLSNFTQSELREMDKLVKHAIDDIRALKALTGKIKN